MLHGLALNEYPIDTADEWTLTETHTNICTHTQQGELMKTKDGVWGKKWKITHKTTQARDVLCRVSTSFIFIYHSTI